MSRSSGRALLLAAAAWLAAIAARAHCPVQYEVTAPAGLFWQVNLGGNHFIGVLPGATTAQLGAQETWVDLRAIDVTGGTMAVTNSFFDGTNLTSCPTFNLDLSGPPACGEDSPTPIYPPCVPHFTALPTGPTTYSCSVVCETPCA